MALKLTLKPHEKAVINGAVIANGDRRASFTIENHANVLRESDIIQPEDATTPAKRVYLPIMLMIVGQERTESLFAEFENPVERIRRRGHRRRGAPDLCCACRQGRQWRLLQGAFLVPDPHGI